MKKILVGLVASALIAGVSASADTNYKILNGMHLNAEYASMNLGGKNVTGYEYGFGYDYFTTNYMLGFNYNLMSNSEYAYSDLNFGSFQFDAGYRILDTLTAYGIVSYDVETNLPMDGVGFGVGIKYQILPYVAINTKYKTTSMKDSNSNSFKYNTINIGLEFNFRTGDGKNRW